MVDMSKTRDSIRVVITTYGSTMSITPETLAFDKWGDKTITTGDVVNTIGINYNYFPTRLNIQPIGKVTESDIIIIIKDTETITAPSGGTQYKVVFNTVTYDVTEVEDYIVNNVTLAKQVVCKKRL